MKLANCLMPYAACLLATAPLAQAGDIVFSSEPPERAARAEPGAAGAWIAGASSTVLAPGLRADLARQADSGAGNAGNPANLANLHAAELRASEIHAGYRAALGPLDVAALVRYDSVPDLHAGGMAGAAERGAFSAGVGWHDLYARYDYTFTRDYLGALDARGSRHLDIGARHALSDTTSLHLNAGDSRAGSAGNALWNWRDVRAGFTRKLDDGWTMALNYRRVYGNTSVAERYTGAPRFEGLIPGIGRGRRGLVLTLNRGF